MIAKRLGWILLGIGIGIGITMAPRLRAQERAARAQTLAFHLTDTSGAPHGSFYYASDSKTHAC